MARTRWPVVLVIFALTACSEGRNQPEPRLGAVGAEVADLKKKLVDETAKRTEVAGEIAELKKRLKLAEETLAKREGLSEVADLKKRLSDAEVGIFLLKADKDRHRTIQLGPTAKGFQRLDTNTDTFLISVQDTQPYLDGYKLTLHIGNPSSASYTGFKLKITWGRKCEKGQTYDQWQKSLQEKEESFTETLRPGSWNKADIILSPAKPETLQYIKLSMEADQVSLVRP